MTDVIQYANDSLSRTVS